MMPASEFSMMPPTAKEQKMPMAVESLTPDSNDKQIQDAISASMEQCMKEPGKNPKTCAGMIYQMARTATGKELNYGKNR